MGNNLPWHPGGFKVNERMNLSKIGVSSFSRLVHIDRDLERNPHNTPSDPKTWSEVLPCQQNIFEVDSKDLTNDNREKRYSWSSSASSLFSTASSTQQYQAEEFIQYAPP